MREAGRPREGPRSCPPEGVNAVTYPLLLEAIHRKHITVLRTTRPQSMLPVKPTPHPLYDSSCLQRGSSVKQSAGLRIRETQGHLCVMMMMMIRSSSDSSDRETLSYRPCE